MKELGYFISMILVYILNVLFFFSGICLNSLVILTFWRSPQLRKKLCYFMIMVLSCFDLLAALVNHPLSVLMALLWLTGKLGIYARWVHTSGLLANILLSMSLLALLAMNFDRYLAITRPLFHRTSVTKRKLLILLAVVNILQISLLLLAEYDFLVSFTVYLLICFTLLFFPMIFINYKLYTISRKKNRNNKLPPGIKKTFSFKNISSCLLAVACFVVLYIPVFVYVALRMISKEKTYMMNDAELAAVWGRTISSMNGTFNCLIFFWKNTILRTEGMKVIKTMQAFGRVQSPVIQSERCNQGQRKMVRNI